jgi:DNA-binding transcriptional ArsR family regulator
MDVERELSTTARLIGDPTRAAILWSLMGGEARPASELALIGNVSNQTASNHLAQLREAGLLSLEKRGRNHFYRLAGFSVASALEALMHISRPKKSEKQVGIAKVKAPSLALARTCYDHLAGVASVEIARSLTKTWKLAPDSGNYMLPDSAMVRLQGMGINVELAKHARRHFAYPCMDWSERLPHIGGALGAAILAWLFECQAIARVTESRQIRITDKGRKTLEEHFGFTIGRDGLILKHRSRAL